MEGAEWQDGLALSSSISTKLDIVTVRWVQRRIAHIDGGLSALPVYLNGDRGDLLFTMRVKLKPGSDWRKIVQRGVAAVAAAH